MARPAPFLGPHKSFPVGDKKHARLAIGGATRAEHAGNISHATAARYRSEARTQLRKLGGGAPEHHFAHGRPRTEP